MDSRVDLVREFYAGMPTDRAKVETTRLGFAYLEELLEGGASLEYGELTLSGMLHKYKLADLPEGRIDGLIGSHVRKECNVCLYFGDRESRLFCFNLDNNHKVNNREVIPEVEGAVRFLAGHLAELGCPPLVVASGRGFHLWCRLAADVDNDRLYTFMLRSAAKAAAELARGGLDHNRVKINLYPDRRTRDTVSLRLFGSKHAATGLFSQVLATEGLLDEGRSWERFEEHLRSRTIGVEAFGRAHDAMAAAF